MAEPQDQTQTALDGLRVCIVDDDAGIRESLRFFFESADYEVMELEDGARALLFLQQTRERWVVLLDRMMPRLDGIGVLRALAEQPEIMRRVVIIFMTARYDPPEAEVHQLLERHTLTSVSKPFDLNALLATVERASNLLEKRVVAE